MDLTFLGTGAADWRRTPKGMEYRRLCSTRVGKNLLIDGNPEILDFLQDPESITDLLYTHAHSDHFNENLWPALPGAKKWAGWDHPDMALVRDGVPFEAAGLKITPLRGNHSVPVLHYYIDDGEKKLYYALDGAWLTYNEYAFLRDKQLDALVMDATIGDGHDGDYRVFEHNSLPMVRIMVDSLRKNGILREGAPVFLTHLAYTLHPDGETLRKTLAPGYIAPMDGETYAI